MSTVTVDIHIAAPPEKVWKVVMDPTRFDEWDHIWREAIRWGLRLLAFLFAIALVLYVLATFI